MAKKRKVHLAKLPESGYGQAFAACSGWLKVPYTLLRTSVTCKSCLRMLAAQDRKTALLKDLSRFK